MVTAHSAQRVHTFSLLRRLPRQQTNGVLATMPRATRRTRRIRSTRAGRDRSDRGEYRTQVSALRRGPASYPPRASSKLAKDFRARDIPSGHLQSAASHRQRTRATRRATLAMISLKQINRPSPVPPPLISSGQATGTHQPRGGVRKRLGDAFFHRLGMVGVHQNDRQVVVSSLS